MLNIWYVIQNAAAPGDHHLIPKLTIHITVPYDAQNIPHTAVWRLRTAVTTFWTVHDYQTNVWVNLKNPATLKYNLCLSFKNNVSWWNFVKKKGIKPTL
jgi:hypothetical protein